jgi:ketosteroid isomerase-like protein
MSQSNVDTVQHVYEAFARGDVPVIVERVSNDTTWGFNASESRVPWHKTTHGKSELPQFFTRVAEHMDFQVFEPRRFIHSGNDVISEVHMEYTVKTTGKKVKEDALFWWTFDNDGKITGLQHFEDTGQVQRACA